MLLDSFMDVSKKPCRSSANTASLVGHSVSSSLSDSVSITMSEITRFFRHVYYHFAIFGLEICVHFHIAKNHETPMYNVFLSSNAENFGQCIESPSPILDRKV